MGEPNPWVEAAHAWESMHLSPGVKVVMVMVITSDGVTAFHPVPAGLLPAAAASDVDPAAPAAEMVPDSLMGLARCLWLAADPVEPRTRKAIIRRAGARHNSHSLAVIRSLLRDGWLCYSNNGMILRTVSLKS